MKIVVGDLEKQITREELAQKVFDVDFGGVMLQITKNTLGGPFLKNAYKVTNGVNGYGNNCFKEYKDKEVIITD